MAWWKKLISVSIVERWWMFDALAQGFWWVPLVSMAVDRVGQQLASRMVAHVQVRIKQIVAALLGAALTGALAGCGPAVAQSNAAGRMSDTKSCPVQRMAPAPSGYPWMYTNVAPARVIGELVAVAPGQPGFVSSVPLVVAARSLTQAIIPGAGTITFVGREGFANDGGLGGTFAYGVIPATLPPPTPPSINVFLPPSKKQVIMLDYCWRVAQAQASLARAHTAADTLALRIMGARLAPRAAQPDLGSGIAGLVALLNQTGATSYLLITGNLVSRHGAVLPTGTRLPAGTTVTLLRYVADGDLVGVQTRTAAWTTTLRGAGAASVQAADITQWRVLGNLFGH